MEQGLNPGGFSFTEELILQVITVKSHRSEKIYSSTLQLSHNCLVIEQIGFEQRNSYPQRFLNIFYDELIYDHHNYAPGTGFTEGLSLDLDL